MRAVVCQELGPPQGLVVEDREPLTARPGQVVLRVAAAGVNYVDALFVSGEYQIKPPLPFVPGSEVAGTVTSVGDGVTDLAVGDRVLAMTGLGGYAEEVAAWPLQCVRLPDRLDLGAAAAFTQSYCTALFALRSRAGLAARESVLVLGAGGGVGQATVDVATALGARVLAAASTEDKRAAARARGAEDVVDTTTEDLKERARAFAAVDGKAGVDVVLDPVGAELAEPALRSLGELGRYLVIGFAGGSIPRLPLNQVLLRNRSVLGVDWGAWQMGHALENRALLEELLGMVADGRLDPPEPTSYPFERVADALDDLRNRKVTGKVVLVP